MHHCAIPRSRKGHVRKGIRCFQGVRAESCKLRLAGKVQQLKVGCVGRAQVVISYSVKISNQSQTMRRAVAAMPA